MTGIKTYVGHDGSCGFQRVLTSHFQVKWRDLKFVAAIDLRSKRRRLGLGSDQRRRVSRKARTEDKEIKESERKNIASCTKGRESYGTRGENHTMAYLMSL